jgi:thioredoxin reductase (NADPH)
MLSRESLMLEPGGDLMFDTIIVGGGPAGLSAALHLAFHKRSVLVIDRRTGPLFYTLTELWNVPGFVAQTGVQIQKTMKLEAEKAGAKIVSGNVIQISGSAGRFVIHSEKDERFEAKTILLATGVARYHPLIAGEYEPFLKYAAKGNTYYCPDCESPELLGKDIVVIGVAGANSAVAEAAPLAEFAKSVRLLLTGGTEFKPEYEAKRQALNLEVIEGQIAAVDGAKGIVKALILEDGTRVEADGFYISSPKFPRSDLAKQLGLQLSPKGHIKTGWRGQVQLEGMIEGEFLAGVWAAGDVQPQTQQVSIAAGSGNIAAVMIDQYLQKLEPRTLGI